jgi:hypothetical protein
MRELRIGVFFFFCDLYVAKLCPCLFLLALDAALYLTGAMFILLPRTKSTKKVLPTKTYVDVIMSSCYLS